MNSAIATINQFPENKTQLNTFVAEIIGQVKEGHINALNLKVRLKMIESAYELIDKATKSEQLAELSRYGKSVELAGFKIEQMEAATRYDYSSCNDLEWSELDAKITALQEQKKEREAFLKGLSRPTAITDSFTAGETITINPPIKTSTSSLKLTMLR